MKKTGFGGGAEKRESDEPCRKFGKLCANGAGAVQHLARDQAVQSRERQRRGRSNRSGVEEGKGVELTRPFEDVVRVESDSDQPGCADGDQRDPWQLVFCSVRAEGDVRRCAEPQERNGWSNEHRAIFELTSIMLERAVERDAGTEDSRTSAESLRA